LLQVAAEELDLDMSQLSSVRLDTNITPNQGGTYSSAAIARGGPQIRTAAAEARMALLQLAAKNFNTTVDRLIFGKGVISIVGSPGRSVTYGQLVGDKPFSIPFTGSAPTKPVDSYSIVGKSPARKEVPDKVSGKYVYMQHVRLPGMLHGRVVRPRGQSAYGAGAKVLNVDETSIRTIADSWVRRGDFGVLHPTNGMRFARPATKVTFYHADFQAPMVFTKRCARKNRRSLFESAAIFPALFFGAAATWSRRNVSPVLSHARLARTCARPMSPRIPRCYLFHSGRHAPHNACPYSRMPATKIRVQYYEGSGTYGHSCHDDVLRLPQFSQQVGSPFDFSLRVGIVGWDNYGPAHVGRRAAANAKVKSLVANVRDGSTLVHG
jgi:hypothetical protein